MVGGTYWGRTFPVLTCYQSINFYSTVVAEGTCGGCGAVGIVPVLAAAIPWRLTMRF